MLIVELSKQQAAVSLIMTRLNQLELQLKGKQLRMPMSTWQPSKSSMQRLKVTNLVGQLHLATEATPNQERMMQPSRT